MTLNVGVMGMVKSLEVHVRISAKAGTENCASLIRTGIPAAARMPAMKVLAFKPRTAIDYQARINRVLAHMAEHLDAELGAGELARVANLSAFHFHRIFRAITGETIGGLTRRLRLERAGQALRRGAPLIEVALDAGYGSPEAFGRAFRDAFGVTPAAYRKVWPPPLQQPPLSLALQLDLNNLRISLEPLQGGTTMDVRIETWPERRAVCARHVGPYNEVGTDIPAHVQMGGGRRRALGPGTMVMGLSYDNPETHAAEELRYDVCFSVRAARRRSSRGPAARNPSGRAFRRAHAARALQRHPWRRSAACSDAGCRRAARRSTTAPAWRSISTIRPKCRKPS